MKAKITKKYINETPLDDYERELQKFLKKGVYVSDPNFKKNKVMFEEMAKQCIESHKTKRISLRVKNKDLTKVKAKAENSGIPYQRLLNVLIHKYAGGEIQISI